MQDFGEKNGLNYEQIAIPSGPKHPDCFNNFGFTCCVARNGSLVIDRIFDGTPAQKSSLQVNHEIIQINSVDIRDYDLDMIERHINSAQHLDEGNITLLCLKSDLTGFFNAPTNEMDTSSVPSLHESITRLRNNVHSRKTIPHFHETPTIWPGNTFHESNK